MARADRLTKLPLDTFAQLMGINPLHFNGIQISEMQRSPCDQVYMQYAWQARQAISREQIAEAIAEAEAMIENYLCARLIPTWEADERQITARAPKPEWVRFGAADVRGFRQTVKPAWGRFISGGVRKQTAVQLAAAITYSNTVRPTSYDNLATVTVTVPDGTEACDVCVYYPGKSGDETWRIRPARVSISGNTATITFQRYQALIEAFMSNMDLTADPNEQIAAGDTDANFLDTVDVYTVTNDPSTQVTLMWEPTAWPLGWCGWCCEDGCQFCSYLVQTGCLMLRSVPEAPILGYAPATWNVDTEQFDATSPCFGWGRQPDQVRLYYLAGIESGAPNACRWDMDPQWAQAVAALAATLLPGVLCSCASNTVERWQTDLAFEQGAEQLSRFKVTQEQLGNPFGTKLGAVFAWNRVNEDGAMSAAGVVNAM